MSGSSGPQEESDSATVARLLFGLLMLLVSAAFVLGSFAILFLTVAGKLPRDAPAGAGIAAGVLMLAAGVFIWNQAVLFMRRRLGEPGQKAALAGWRTSIGLCAAFGVGSLSCLVGGVISGSGESLILGVVLAAFAYRSYARAMAAKRAELQP